MLRTGPPALAVGATSVALLSSSIINLVGDSACIGDVLIDNSTRLGQGARFGAAG